jgi:glycerate kinase
MRAVFAPDSYGGFLSAPAACRLVRKLLGARGVELQIHPMADGGEGTREVLAFHGGVGSVQVIESARLLGPGREAMGGCWHQRSSLPLGLAMARPGDGPLVVGLGGTATMDGGVGALQALGLTLRDAGGRALPRGLAATSIHRVASVHGPMPLRGRLMELLVDVRSPLLRAPELYGPQKGLTAMDIADQGARLEGWAAALGAWREGHGLEALPLDLSGGGAAGGLGFALACVGARLVPGAARIAALTRLDERLRGADVLVLGEGRMDATSFEGKVADVVLGRARSLGAGKVFALVGSARDLPPAPAGPDLVIPTGRPGMEAFVTAVEALGDALQRS